MVSCTITLSHACKAAHSHFPIVSGGEKKMELGRKLHLCMAGHLPATSGWLWCHRGHVPQPHLPASHSKACHFISYWHSSYTSPPLHPPTHRNLCCSRKTLQACSQWEKGQQMTVSCNTAFSDWTASNVWNMQQLSQWLANKLLNCKKTEEAVIVHLSSLVGVKFIQSSHT